MLKEDISLYTIVPDLACVPLSPSPPWLGCSVCCCVTCVVVMGMFWANHSRGVRLKVGVIRLGIEGLFVFLCVCVIVMHCALRSSPLIHLTTGKNRKNTEWKNREIYTVVLFCAICVI